MEISTKKQIAEQLANYVQNIAGSMNKASKTLKGVSVATISNILAGKHESLSDDMFRNIAKQIGFGSEEWVSVDTTNSQLLTQLFNDARLHANTFGVCGDPGSGKTHVARQYSHAENVYLVCCNEYFNRKTFLSELLHEMGRDAGGYTVSEMMFTVVSHVRRAENPLIILDEADKLSDQVLYFFISLYNQLSGKCGILLMATDHLEKRISRGIRLNKKGYKEIYSRLGRRFIHLPHISKKDVSTVVRANGIEDDLMITEIFNKAEGDLRRVERLVHSNKKGGER